MRIDLEPSAAPSPFLAMRFRIIGQLFLQGETADDGSSTSIIYHLTLLVVFFRIHVDTLAFTKGLIICKKCVNSENNEVIYVSWIKTYAPPNQPRLTRLCLILFAFYHLMLTCFLSSPTFPGDLDMNNCSSKNDASCQKEEKKKPSSLKI